MFFASAVLLEMLSMAGVKPERLNRTIDVRLKQGLSATMLWDDHFPRLLGKESGTRVRRLRRRSRYILLEFDRAGAFYIERGRSDREFLCRGSLPSSVQIASIGRRMDQVIDTGVLSPMLAEEIIRLPATAYQGAVAFALEERWRKFG